MERSYNVILITGPPGVGKTTLVRKMCDELRKTYVCRGFVTEEVRSDQSSARIGFDVVTLAGERTRLAREQAENNFRLPKVGKYSVYVKDFEEIVLPLLSQPYPFQGLLVIDEIGKMELKSKTFATAVGKLIGSTPILATIPYRPRERLPLVEQLRNSPAAKVFEISRNNRDNIQNDIMKSIENMLQKKNN